MELTYWSIILLGYIFLHWALLASAEEGEWFYFIYVSNRLVFCVYMAEWLVQILLHPATLRADDANITEKLKSKSQGNHHGDIIAGYDCSPKYCMIPARFISIWMSVSFFRHWQDYLIYFKLVFSTMLPKKCQKTNFSFVLLISSGRPLLRPGKC